MREQRDLNWLLLAELTCLSPFQENNMIVYVEKKVLEDPAIVSDDNFGPVKKKFCTFREGEFVLGSVTQLIGIIALDLAEASSVLPHHGQQRPVGPRGLL